MALEYDSGREILARLDPGEDIIEQILLAAGEAKVETGVFRVIGALKTAEIGFYDQEEHVYRSTVIDGATELVTCEGNLSQRDEKPFVHAHATLASSDYNLVGGHLLSGAVFAAELHLKELRGKPPVRRHDPVTGLYLWERP